MNKCPDKLIYNPVTKNCIQNTAANRKRIAGYDLTDDTNVDDLIAIFQPLSIHQNVTNHKARFDESRIVFCAHKCKNKQLYLSPTLDQGDCEFDSVRQIINSEDTVKQWTIKNLRMMCASEMRKVPIRDLVTIRTIYDEDRITEQWMIDLPPSAPIREYLDALTQAMKTSDFWGDQYTLNMMASKLKLQFLILDRYCNVVHHTPSPAGSHIGLLYRDGMHFQPLYTLTDENEKRFVFNFDDKCIKALYELSWS